MTPDLVEITGNIEHIHAYLHWARQLGPNPRTSRPEGPEVSPLVLRAQAVSCLGDELLDLLNILD